MSTEAFDRIKKWARLINQKPNYDCTFFYLSENEKAMIIDVGFMKEKPPVLTQLSTKNKAYLFVDLNNDKSCRYYAHDITQSDDVVNEIEGEILIENVERYILFFIEKSMKEISSWEDPYSQFVRMNKIDLAAGTSTSSTALTTNQPTVTRQTYDYRDNKTTTPYGQFGYHTNQYSNSYAQFQKRDKFVDGIVAMVKQGRTAAAIDTSREWFKENGEDKELVGAVLRGIVLEKIDVMVAREIIFASLPLKDNESDRTSFISKVKIHIENIKPYMSDSLLKEAQ